MAANSNDLLRVVLTLATLTVFFGCPPPLPPGTNSNDNSANDNAAPKNRAPVIDELLVQPMIAEVGEPVLISWRITDADGDTVRAVISIDEEGRDDYTISDTISQTSIEHTYRNAGTATISLHASDASTTTSATSAPIRINGPISIRITTPSSDQPVLDTVQVNASVESEFSLESVSATVLSVTNEMTLQSRPYYVSELDISDAPSGPQLLIVRARDVLGNEAEQVRGFIVDRPSLFHAIEPRPEAVVNAQLRVHVTCTDDVGICEDELVWYIPAYTGGTGLGQIGDELIREIDASQFLGFYSTLHAYNTTGQLNVASWFFIDDLGQLERVYSAEARIIQIAGNRVALAADPLQVDMPYTYRWKNLSVVDRASGAAIDVQLPDGKYVSEGYVGLIGNGAVFGTRTNGDEVVTDAIYRTDGVSVTTLGQGWSRSIRAAGDFAAWSAIGGLRLHHFSTNTTIQIAGGSFDLHENGLLVYATNNDIRKYLEGVTTVLAASNGNYLTAPQTDGERTVFARWHGDRYYGLAVSQVVLIEPNGAEIDISGEMEYHVPDRGTGYQLNNGWIAFTSPDRSHNTQVWRRNPDGGLEQITFFGDFSYLDALGAHGEVFFIRAGRRYLSQVGEEPREIDRALGKVHFIDGQAFIAIGGSLFRVQ
ncbi:MAG: hypothetical protein JNG88_06005 [Phycisphaerales bacterium]|nr:hypothetical protein [Phycisphaerales bacterium]